ncbi:MAG: hypothetical protein ACD_46C00683G0002 [uncultured bacterium]|nr:MAG: hypothetical protein ACD_46C00683G0002 [uncultured bacterium]
MEKSLFKAAYYLTIEADFVNQRLDNFLITKLKNMPKTRIYRILRKGEVRVNKKRVQPSYRLQVGDRVRIPPMHLSEKTSAAKPSQSLMTLLATRILYEDNYLLILNKPSGVPVHGGSQVKIGIIEALRCMYPNLPHLELAHRLDSDTSGCLILAKKRSILKELHELLRLGKMRKIYMALTQGHWKPSELRVEVALQKSYLQGGERIVKVDSQGKTALTVFKPIETLTGAMLVEATLHTGRTHQIRVHAKYRRHPIAGDEKYGDKEFNKKMRQHGLGRLFLHAKSIGFVLPSIGQTVKVTAPLDDDLADCLRLIRVSII